MMIEVTIATNDDGPGFSIRAERKISDEQFGLMLKTMESWKSSCVGDPEEQAAAPTNGLSAIRKQIRRRREELGWSRNDLALKAKMSAGYIGQIETDPKVGSEEAIQKISQVLQLTA